MSRKNYTQQVSMAKFTVTKSVKKTYILLAAGQNRGTSKTPKSLTFSGGTYLIDSQISTIKKRNPENDVVVVCGFESKKIIEYLHLNHQVKIVENPNYKTTTSLESLRIGLNVSDNCGVVVIHGDREFNLEAISFDDRYPCIIESQTFDKNSIGFVSNGKVLQNMSYGLKNTWGQIAYFPKSMFLDLRRCVNSVKPQLNIFEVINQLNNNDQFLVHSNKSVEIKEL